MVWKRKVPLASCKHSRCRCDPNFDKELFRKRHRRSSPLSPSHASHGTTQIFELVVIWRSATPSAHDALSLRHVQRTRHGSRWLFFSNPSLSLPRHRRIHGIQHNTRISIQPHKMHQRHRPLPPPNPHTSVPHLLRQSTRLR